jgi:proteic killer suppression protein
VVDVSFRTPRLRKVCTSDKELRRAHGEDCARKLMARLADLRAAPRLEELRNLPGRCHELDGNRKGQLAVELTGGKRLVFEPLEASAAANEVGGLDWKQVEAVRVVEIVDYHEKKRG